MKYDIESILTSDGKGGRIGPMSSVLLSNLVSKKFSIPQTDLLRLENNQAINATYDHLIIYGKYKSGNIKILIFVDLGDCALPVAIYYSKDEELYITDVYKENITNKARVDHLIDMEQSPASDDKPIMELGFDEVINIVNQILKSKKEKQI